MRPLPCAARDVGEGLGRELRTGPLLEARVGGRQLGLLAAEAAQVVFELVVSVGTVASLIAETSSASVRRLITIPISHYCEKARWALDRAGLAYREERHVQGVHQVVSKRAGATARCRC